MYFPSLSLSIRFLLLLSPLFPYMGALWVMSVAFVLVPSSRFRSKSKGSFYSGLKDQGFVLVKDKIWGEFFIKFFINVDAFFQCSYFLICIRDRNWGGQHNPKRTPKIINVGAELKVRHMPIYWERIPLDHENPLNCRWQMITNSKKIFQNFSVWNILANARHWDSEWTLPSVFMYTFSRVLKIEKIRKLPNTWFRPENSIIATSLTFWKTRMKISISCSQYMKCWF